MSDNPTLLFLKLGGSLITDKTRARAARLDTIARLADELRLVRSQLGDLRLVLGHGSGSFGHIPAKKYGTRQGIVSPDGWRGFVEVWHEAVTLNRIVMDALHTAGLPGIDENISQEETSDQYQHGADIAEKLDMNRLLAARYFRNQIDSFDYQRCHQSDGKEPYPEQIRELSPKNKLQRCRLTGGRQGIMQDVRYN